MEDRFKRKGIISWHELMTSNVDGAKKFYADLLGWTYQEFPMEKGGSYWVAQAGEEGVGGIMGTPPEAAGVPPHWGLYITVDNVDAITKKAEQIGATIVVSPTDIPKVGRFAVLQDPQGAVFAIITYLSDT